MPRFSRTAAVALIYNHTPWLIAQSAGNRRRGPDRKLVRNLGKRFNRVTLHSMQWLLWHSLLAFAHVYLRSSVLECMADRSAGEGNLLAKA